MNIETKSADASGRAGRARRLNDTLRRTGEGGRTVMTAGVAALPDTIRAAIVDAVHRFDCFVPDNDPYAEHDFGEVLVDGQHVFWKIDYYDRSLTAHSPDPADPAVTTRVLTIMLAAEY